MIKTAKILFVLVAITLFVLTGCQEKQEVKKEVKNSEIIKTAWDSLTEEQKKTVNIDWQKAKVTELEVTEKSGYILTNKTFKTGKAYAVEFTTNQDPLLGSIVILVDQKTKKIVGVMPRE